MNSTNTPDEQREAQTGDVPSVRSAVMPKSASAKRLTANKQNRRSDPPQPFRENTHMAYVVKFTDGYNHIINSTLSTLHTLCGICDDPNNKQQGEMFKGRIDCDACREAVAIVFESCTKRDIK